MLIIPAVAELGSAQFIPSRGPMGLACSNLADYLMRAWCQFEVLVGLFGNSSVTIAYQIGRSLQDKEKHQEGHFDQDDASEEKKEDPVEGPPFIDTYDPKNGAISFQQVRNVSCSTIDLGFTSASYETLRGSITGGDGGLSMLDIMPEATLSRISAKLLNCLEPTQLLSALLNFGNTLYHEDQAAFSMIQSCVDFDIQKLSTYRSGKWAAQVNKIYALLGVCAVENDKNVVLCLLLACTSFLVSQTQRYAS
uniref:Uncharacterized protein n=1 Tax=Heterosigma akashiwo TaxID=2829 RepID=A0A7S3XW80_HETAK